MRICKVEQAIDQIGDLAELTYLDKELVSEAQNIYASLNADEQKLVCDSETPYRVRAARQHSNRRAVPAA